MRHVNSNKKYGEKCEQCGEKVKSYWTGKENKTVICDKCYSRNLTGHYE